MNMYNPYIQQMSQPQDLGGLNPVFQNIANQQAMQNMAMQQAQGLTQDAGRTVQGGMNPLAMAMMLRKGQDQKNINAANAEMSAFNQRPAQNYYSASMNPMNIQSDMDY
jgi:hypothetical protein